MVTGLEHHSNQKAQSPFPGSKDRDALGTTTSKERWEVRPEMRTEVH